MLAWTSTGFSAASSLAYLPLGGEVAEPRGNSQQEAVVLLQLRRVMKRGDVSRLGGRVHLCEDLVAERLGDPSLESATLHHLPPT